MFGSAPRGIVCLVAFGKKIIFVNIIRPAIIKRTTAANFIKHVAEDGMSAQHVIEINRMCVIINIISNMMEKIMPDDISLVVPGPTLEGGFRPFDQIRRQIDALGPGHCYSLIDCGV